MKCILGGPPPWIPLGELATVPYLFNQFEGLLRGGKEHGNGRRNKGKGEKERVG